MRRVLLSFLIIVSIPIHAQDSPSFDSMSAREIRHFLLNQELSECANKYARRHRNTRNIGNAFLIASGAIVISGIAYDHMHKYEQNSWEELGHGFVVAGFISGAGLALITSGILHLISRQHLTKARIIYLNEVEMNEKSKIGLGVTINF